MNWHDYKMRDDNLHNPNAKATTTFQTMSWHFYINNIPLRSFKKWKIYSTTLNLHVYNHKMSNFLEFRIAGSFIHFVQPEIPISDDLFCLHFPISWLQAVHAVTTTKVTRRCSPHKHFNFMIILMIWIKITLTKLWKRCE